MHPRTLHPRTLHRHPGYASFMRWLAVSLLLVTLMLVPFFLFEGYFNTLAARIVAGRISPWAAGLAIAALLGSDVVLPIPSSLVSAAAGVLLGFLGAPWSCGSA